MLNLWQRTLQYIEGQNAWISSLQSIIAEKEQNYKSLHSLITKEILKELGRITVDVDDDVKIEEDIKEECADDVIDDIQPTQEVQIDAEEVAHFNRLLVDCNRQSKTTTWSCVNDNEGTSIGQRNSNAAIITEDQDGIMEEQDDINEEQDDINEEQDDIMEDPDGINEGQDDIMEDQDGIMEEQDDINEERDDINEEIKMNCETSYDYEGDENKAEDSDDQEIIDVETFEDGIDENIEELRKFNEFQPGERRILESVAIKPQDMKEYIQQKNKQEETNVDSESYHVIEGTSEKQTDTQMENEAAFDGTHNRKHRYADEKSFHLVIEGHIDTRMENEAGFDDVNEPADTTYDEQHKYTGEKTFKCSYCEKSFQQSDDLEEHILKHKLCETPYKCIYCPMTFRRNRILKSHMYIHTDDNDRLKCINCEKYFNQASALQKHMRNHKRNPFKCLDCGKSFRTMTKWKTHIMRTYSCKKPWKCTQCEKLFACSTFLQKHLWLHTGEKTFKCKQCSKTFTASKILARHMHMQHVPKKLFKCAQCSKSFTFSNGLARHMSIHHRHGIHAAKHSSDTSEKQTGTQMENEEFCDDTNDLAETAYDDQYTDEKKTLNVPIVIDHSDDKAT